MKLKTPPAAILLPLALLLSSPFAQTQGPPARQTPPDDSDVVRITSNLVQLDVTVTDKDGRPVADLRPEDFELYEDGRAREITNFSYITTGDGAEAPAPPAAAEAKERVKGAPPAPAAPLRRHQVRRTIALVVDTLKMSHMSVKMSRDGLRKFVDEQMRPGDLVGIYTTRGGAGALQQFTSDRAQLHKAIDRVRWYPPQFGDSGVDVFEAERRDDVYKPIRPGTGGQRGGGVDMGRQTFEDEASRQRREATEARNRDLTAYGALGTLRYVIRGMGAAPGRKTVVLFSDGLPLRSLAAPGALGNLGRNDRALGAIDRLVDAANRASVVIYTVDARGLFTSDLISAGDDVPPSATTGVRSRRETASREAEQGLYHLAEETGGLFFHNMNNLDRAVERALRDQSGYYLLGYRPSEQTFKGGAAAFRRVSVRVKRPGLEVRSRRGFVAVTDEEARREARGSDSELYSALASPVGAGGVYVRLTARVIGDGRAGAAARLLLHLDGQDLTFTEDAGGYRKLVLDVAAVTLGREGEIVDEFTRTHTVRTGGDVLENVRRNGLTYSADVPLKKPGIYHLRIVVRDQASGRLGSASQLIEVPDFGKPRLAVSGLSLREATAGGSPAAEPARATAETALAPVASPSDPAVRRFRPGALLIYNYQVYNPAPDPSTKRPRLTARVLLFRNGEPVLTGPDEAVEFDPARGWAEGGMRLSPDAQPGEYVLQVVVRDEAAKGREVSQWVDFEVVR